MRSADRHTIIAQTATSRSEVNRRRVCAPSDGTIAARRGVSYKYLPQSIADSGVDRSHRRHDRHDPAGSAALADLHTCARSR